ncbi:YceD family protein [Aliiroseovarius sp. 2305UL8-7]|uniref:YceD family protein n=1 Tax=Aliiroseovarius conchicola TaxID=3121637 RepID=UPI00352805DD
MNDTSPSANPPFSHLVRVADLATGRATPFELLPDQAACDAIAKDLSIPALRKLRFTGSLKPLGKQDWQMNAELGATVVQNCVVTLEPVTTRIDDKVERRWLKHLSEFESADEADQEIEMSEDDNSDPLTDMIDLGQVMIEALAIALPLYPRAEGAEVANQVFTEPGSKPMSDDDAKPFAGLSALRDKLSDRGE